MKNWKSGILAVTALLALPSLQSCLNDNDYDYDYSLMMPSAIVTVKPVVSEDRDYFYMQLNDEEKLWPVNNGNLPYDEKEVRAFVNYTETDMPDDVDKEVYSKAVKVNWMDSILTKKPVICGSPEETGNNAAAEYGSDPVALYIDWMTNVEDGYLTIHFYTRGGNTGIKHELNLLTGLNPDDPYEVYFKHNAHGDNSYSYADGIVAFRLEDLPDTQGETVDLTLKFDSLDGGTKTVKFEYRSREDW